MCNALTAFCLIAKLFILALTGSLRLLLPLDRRLFVVLPFANLLNDAVPRCLFFKAS